VRPVAILVCLAGSQLPIRADVIYSNVTPQFPASSPSASGSGTAPGGIAYVATTFVPGVTRALGSISTAAYIQHCLGVPGTILTFQLRADASGTPGAVLESWTASVPGYNCLGNPSPRSLTTLPSVQNPVLSAGATYWFMIQLTLEPEQIDWYYNDTGLTGPEYIYSSGQTSLLPGYPAPGMIVQSMQPSSVPVPVLGDFALIALAAMLSVLGAFRIHMNNIAE
jgi:hypothetical protein